MESREHTQPGAQPGALGQEPKRQAGRMDTQKMKDQASQATSEARDKVSDMAHSAADAVDQRRGQASDAMDMTATQIRERGESLPGGERTTEIAARAADKMEATSAYLREHDVQDMVSDLETLVRQHPTQSLIAAAAAGFLVGRMLR